MWLKHLVKYTLIIFTITITGFIVVVLFKL